jgi:hypothetical protein
VARAVTGLRGEAVMAGVIFLAIAIPAVGVEAARFGVEGSAR